jgi:hypothetical protein
MSIHEPYMKQQSVGINVAWMQHVYPQTVVSYMVHVWTYSLKIIICVGVIQHLYPQTVVSYMVHVWTYSLKIIICVGIIIFKEYVHTWTIYETTLCGYTCCMNHTHIIIFKEYVHTWTIYETTVCGYTCCMTRTHFTETVIFYLLKF